MCKQPGHFGKHCHQKKSESTGERLQNKGAKLRYTSTKQVNTQSVPPEPSPEHQPVSVGSSSDNPLDCLVSLDSEGDSQLNAVRIKVTGSKNQFASVDLHGVPVKGMIDSGADITILHKDGLVHALASV